MSKSSDKTLTVPLAVEGWRRYTSGEWKIPSAGLKGGGMGSDDRRAVRDSNLLYLEKCSMLCRAALWDCLEIWQSYNATRGKEEVFAVARANRLDSPVNPFVNLFTVKLEKYLNDPELAYRNANQALVKTS